MNITQSILAFTKECEACYSCLQGIADGSSRQPSRSVLHDMGLKLLFNGLQVCMHWDYCKGKPAAMPCGTQYRRESNKQSFRWPLHLGAPLDLGTSLEL